MLRVPIAGRRPVYHRARQGQWIASVLLDNPVYHFKQTFRPARVSSLNTSGICINTKSVIPVPQC
jgi:hypothetical protein